MAPPIRLKGLDHLVLRTDNADRMIRFYCDVLSCTVERRRDDIGLIQLRAGHTLIDLVTLDGPLGAAGGAAPGREGRNLDHFCLAIERFNETALRKHLAQHGVQAGPTETRYGAGGFGPSVYLHDPDGNTVELKGPPIVT
jgi:catechol 2,3-dioxygenase-like lactoylglutathione lyase family enzyme